MKCFIFVKSAKSQTTSNWFSNNSPLENLEPWLQVTIRMEATLSSITSNEMTTETFIRVFLLGAIFGAGFWMAEEALKGGKSLAIVIKDKVKDQRRSRGSNSWTFWQIQLWKSKFFMRKIQIEFFSGLCFSEKLDFLGIWVIKTIFDLRTFLGIKIQKGIKSKFLNISKKGIATRMFFSKNNRNNNNLVWCRLRQCWWAINAFIRVPP